MAIQAIKIPRSASRALSMLHSKALSPECMRFHAPSRLRWFQELFIIPLSHLASEPRHLCVARVRLPLCRFKVQILAQPCSQARHTAQALPLGTLAKTLNRKLVTEEAETGPQNRPHLVPRVRGEAVLSSNIQRAAPGLHGRWASLCPGSLGAGGVSFLPAPCCT